MSVRDTRQTLLAGILLLLAFSAGAVLAESPPVPAATAAMNVLNPLSVGREWQRRVGSGMFYAPDGSTHRGLSAAIRRAVQPTDLRANVKSAVVSKLHFLSLLNIWMASFSVELQRQLAAGNGIDPWKLAGALTDVRSILGGFVGWAAADAFGAVVQSALARTGLAGGIAGFVFRQTLAFSGFLLGMGVGENSGKGLSARAMLAEAIRRFEPLRDIGQTFGYGLGAVAGQFAIPFFPIGTVIGGIAGGTLGALTGNKLAQGPLSGVDRDLRGRLQSLADWIDDRPPGAREPASPPASAPTPRVTPVTKPAALATTVGPALDADDLILRD